MKEYLPHKFAPHPPNLLLAPEWVEEQYLPDSLEFPFPLETLDAEGIPNVGYRTTPLGSDFAVQYRQLVTWWFVTGYWWWVMAKPVVSDREFEEVERRIGLLELEAIDELKPYMMLPLPMGLSIRRFHPMWSEHKYPDFIRNGIFARCPIRLRLPWENPTHIPPPVQVKTFVKRPPKIR